ncbi:MAG: DUF4118 domain-containing protein, partial [Dehalococcoidia bacterium]
MQRFRDALAIDLPEGVPRTLLGYAVALGTVILTTAALLPLREELGLVNVVLVFLLLVVLIAARWGWGPGLFGSVAANVAFNFFFVPPFYRFTVQEPRNVLALAIFLGVATLTSALLGRARAGEAAARRREQETAILYELSRLIIVQPDTATTLTAICDRVRTAFAVDSCGVLLPADRGLLPAAWGGPFDTAPATAFERRAAEQAFASGQTIFLNDPRGRRRPRIVGRVGAK